MGYEAALAKSWSELIEQGAQEAITVKFLADEYSVDPQKKKVFSLSCNIPAKDFTAILILHYMARKLKGLPKLTGQWLTFREFSGIEGYAAAFHKRAIEPLIRKYGSNPAGILEVLKRLPAEESSGGDVAIVVMAFAQVPVLVKLWKGDEEFGPDANIYFDRSITEIFCTEDIVVLAGMVGAAL
jgi:hypothetical protein